MSRPSASPLAAGFAALGRGRLILLFAVASALLGIAGASPLGPAMRDAFSGTLAGDHLVRNEPSLAPVDVLDLLRAKRIAIAGAAGATRWAAVLAILLQIFLAGGVVETLGRPEAERGLFWLAARRHLGHNFKCFLLFLAAAAVVLGIWAGASLGIGRALFRHAAPHTPAAAAWLAASVAVALLLFGVLTLLYDFARAARRSSPVAGALAGVRVARTRLRGRWARGLALLAFWAGLGAAGVAVLLAAAWYQSTPSGAAVAVNLTLVAGALVVRSATRVGCWGSMLALYDSAEFQPSAVGSQPSAVGSLPPAVGGQT